MPRLAFLSLGCTLLLAAGLAAAGVDGPQVGETAPDFDLPRLGGGRLGLYKTAADRKATLLMFWTENCKACRAQFPAMQKLYAELGEKGLGVVAVNRGDPEPLVERFARDAKATFPVVMGGGEGSYAVGRAYGVGAYPTNLLLAPDGKVLFRAVGYSEEVIRKFLKKAGVE